MSRTPAEQTLWQTLKAGDKVAFLPSSLDVRASKKNFREWLLGNDLELYKSKDEDFENYFGDCGTPKQRAEAIIDALQSEEVKAIFMRGGGGADEVIEHLKKYDAEHGLPKRAIPLIGFSDTTQMQHYLGSIGVCSGVQGVDPSALMLPEWADQTKKRMQERLAALTGEEREKFVEEIKGTTRWMNFSLQASQEIIKFLREGVLDEVPLVAVNDAAKASSVIEGKMEVFNEHDRRSSYRLVSEAERKSILLLEGGMAGGSVTDGIKFAIDWMRSRGELENFSVIILSQSDGKCFGGKKITECDFTEIKAAIGDLEIPVFFGAPFGHGQIFSASPLPLHTESKITTSERGVVLSSEATRSKEDVELIAKICAARSAYVEAKKEPEDAGVIHQELAVRVASNPKNIGLDGGKDYVACQVKSYHRGFDIPALDGVDLSEKNLLLDCTVGFPSFAEWQERQSPEKRVAELYDQEKFKGFKQAVQMSLMELLKVGKLQEAASVVILSRSEVPEKFNDWLKNFVEDHGLSPAFLVAHAPDFPADKLSREEPKVVKATLGLDRAYRAEAGHSH